MQVAARKRSAPAAVGGVRGALPRVGIIPASLHCRAARCAHRVRGARAAEAEAGAPAKRRAPHGGEGGPHRTHHFHHVLTQEERVAAAWRWTQTTTVPVPASLRRLAAGAEGQQAERADSCCHACTGRIMQGARCGRKAWQVRHGRAVATGSPCPRPSLLPPAHAPRVRFRTRSPCPSAWRWCWRSAPCASCPPSAVSRMRPRSYGATPGPSSPWLHLARRARWRRMVRARPRPRPRRRRRRGSSGCGWKEQCRTAARCACPSCAHGSRLCSRPRGAPAAGRPSAPGASRGWVSRRRRRGRRRAGCAPTAPTGAPATPAPPAVRPGCRLCGRTRGCCASPPARARRRESGSRWRTRCTRRIPPRGNGAPSAAHGAAPRARAPASSAC